MTKNIHILNEQFALELFTICSNLCEYFRFEAQKSYSRIADVRKDVAKANILMASISEIDLNETFTREAAQELRFLLDQAPHTLNNVYVHVFRLDRTSRELAETARRLAACSDAAPETIIKSFYTLVSDLVDSLQNAESMLFGKPLSLPDISLDDSFETLLSAFKEIAKSLGKSTSIIALPLGLRIQEWIGKWQPVHMSLTKG